MPFAASMKNEPIQKRALIKKAIMRSELIDIEQRNQALSPADSFIVQAPAGSGKTELLIQRYLRLLGIAGAPEEIIAITFTRKAAAEMRGRVIHALQMAAEDNADGVTEKTIELARAARAQDEKHNWQLVDNPGRLRIQTIDALCAFLTRRMPIVAGFGAQPETVEDARELYKQAAANTLAEIESDQHWSAAIATLLTHLDNDLPALRTMLAGMLARRDQWLRHVVGQPERRELEAALRQLVEASLQAMQPRLHERLDAEFLACVAFAARNLAWEGGEFSCLPGAAADDLASWRFIVDLCLTREGEWRKRVNKGQGFPAAAAQKEMKQRFQTMLARLASDDELRACLLEIRALPPVGYSEQEWQVLNALYQLLILADAQLRVLFAEKNQIDFSGITQAAIQALGSEEAPSDLALHLDYRIKHILLDEFQDISINQYVLLERLTAGWSGQDGHSLFLVGDPMQSIYRFREAEVGLFLNTWKEARLGQVPLKPLNIRLNFRAKKSIVEWVNNTFSQVLPHNPDLSRGAVAYVKADAFDRQEDGQAVTHHPIVGRDHAREAETVVELIKSAREKRAQEKIAILVRNRSHLHEIIPALRQAGLRFRAVEIDRLGTQAAIMDLLALTHALSHFADRIAWLAVLRAPWCGLSLGDLFILGKDKDKTIWQCMNEPARCQALSHAGQLRLASIRKILQAAFAERGRRHLSRWVESVWMSIGGPATLTDETALENTRSFFDLIEKFDQGGNIKDRAVFAQQVAELSAAADVTADDTLQLMTIHKAKGLEFDTVILPGLCRGSATDKTELLLWMELPRPARQALLLAPIKAAGESALPPIYRYLRQLENEKQRYEEGRLLYVAATRAKRKLHLLHTIKPQHTEQGLQPAAPPYNSLLAQLWPLVKDGLVDLLSADEDAAEVARPALLPSKSMRRLAQTWQLPAAPDPVRAQDDRLSATGLSVQADAMEGIEFAWASETIRHVGSVVHRYIQLFAEQGIDSWNPQRVKARMAHYALALRRLGVVDAALHGASARVAQALINLLADARGRWLLSNEHQERINEYALSGLHQGRLVKVIIDRTFVDQDGTRWIIDYKTGRHEGGDTQAFLDQERARYQDQLEKYAALLSAMEDRPIKLGLYFPLLKGWREWDYVKEAST